MKDRKTTSAFRTLSSWRLLALLACLALLQGCAAVTNPVADGVPVRHLPPEVLGHPRGGECTVPLSLLGQKPPEVYAVAAGDVLGVWIEGVLGDRLVAPPLITPPSLPRDQRRLRPAMGYPVPVRPDGTIVLPQIDPLPVAGMSLPEIQAAIRRAYVAKKILKADTETVIVTLLQPRQVHVLVMRQESQTFTPSAEGVINSSKRGTGFAVDLGPYENDVLHALAQTGGLPGEDACNEIIIHRACFQDVAGRAVLGQHLLAGPPGAPLALDMSKVVTRIPLRVKPGQPLPFRPEDAILCSGDVVFLEARDKDVFYTAGLLPAGEHPLPRDRPLDVIEAIARVRGPMVNGAFATNNLSGNLIQAGIGDDNPSLLIVVRRLPDGRQIPIRVDLNRALQDARERILVQPGDVLILQETPCAALARYFGRTVFNFSVAWQFFHDRFLNGVLDISAPERIPSRIGISNIRSFGQ
jgi:hypothetical protein